MATTSASGLGREVLGLVRRHWLAVAIPAALLGAVTDLVVVLRGDVAASIALGVALGILFELYVGYAEAIVAADRAPAPRPPVRALARRAALVAPALVVASVAAVSLPLLATGLLVVPGLWLLTRWVLVAPAVVHEGLGPRAALARSSALVRGAFWTVAATATASLLLEHAVIHASAHSAEPLLGSLPLALVGAGLATAIVSPFAAFTISVVYERRAAGERAW